MRPRSLLLLLSLALLGGLALLLGGLRPLEAEPQPPAPPPAVLVGIDVLEGEGFAPLRGKRVGLITNQTGQTSDGRRTIDLLREAPGVTVAAGGSPRRG